jgi:predicted DNA-binding transcriptional regulator AlpA
MNEFLTVEELAARWKVNPNTIYRMKDDKTDPLPHYKLKGSIRFKLMDIEQYEQTHRIDKESKEEES